MREVRGNLWDFMGWKAITTNGSIRHDGRAVMGRGVALQAVQRFPAISRRLGRSIQRNGNRVQVIDPYNFLISFPVKHQWWERADIKLIRRSCRELVEWADIDLPKTVYLVRPGCGNGQLRWEVVKPVIASLLDDRFVIVEQERV